MYYDRWIVVIGRDFMKGIGDWERERGLWIGVLWGVVLEMEI